jgi:hypothetical protein
MHIFNVKSVRDKNIYMESLKYFDSPQYLVRFVVNRYHRLLVKNEKYSCPPLIIGHFHIKYMKEIKTYLWKAFNIYILIEICII